MAVLAYGLSHQTAPVDVRERIAFPEQHLEAALRDLTSVVPGVSEAAILSTCNRTELYCVVEPPAQSEVSAWLSRQRPIEPTELENLTYLHWDKDAARHLIRVAAGLDSQVLGEPQILGQVRAAIQTAREAGTLGPELTLLTDLGLNTAKQVRTDTDIGRNPVSVAYTAVSLARQIFADLRSKHALLLGAGETISRVAEHLKEAGIGSIAIANRTLRNAETLAAQFSGEAMQLTDIAAQLHRFDIVIGSTGSSLPVLGKGAVEDAIRRRRRRPMFLVDIAVPRDIEPGVGDLSDVYLYSIDDLASVIEASTQSRLMAAEAAEELVDAGASRYLARRRVQLDRALLAELRGNAMTLKEREVERALRDVDAGKDPALVVEQLAHSLTNKLIHAPTAGLRKASEAGRTDLVDLIKELYGLS
ncbi:MAG: glutamyl-tRNA reductase [Pseudomonadota bacterium]